MNERKAFLDHMARDPHDDTSRLVFADWLEEHGEHAPAHALRRSVRVGNAVRAADPAGPHGTTAPVKLTDKVGQLHVMRRLLEHADTGVPRLNTLVRQAIGLPAELHAVGLLPEHARYDVQQRLITHMHGGEPLDPDHHRLLYALHDFFHRDAREPSPDRQVHWALNGAHHNNLHSAATHAVEPPVKLARIPGPGDQQPHVTVRVPVPTQPVKPRPQPTTPSPVFFLPG